MWNRQNFYLAAISRPTVFPLSFGSAESFLIEMNVFPPVPVQQHPNNILLSIFTLLKPSEYKVSDDIYAYCTILKRILWKRDV